MEVYIFAADIYCDECGEAIKAQTTPPEGVDPANPDECLYDSGDYPKGPYPDGGGESDSPQHCGQCGVFLDNPLTGDGETYVRDAFMEFVETGRGDVHVLREWRDAYDWCFDDFKAIGLDMRREEKELSEIEEYRLAELCRD